MSRSTFSPSTVPAISSWAERQTFTGLSRGLSLLNPLRDEILRKLEAQLDRRRFLRGYGVGVAATSLLVVFAESQDKPFDKKKKPEDRKKDEDAPTDSEQGEKKVVRVEGKDGKFYDAENVEVRECLECGHNLYQQGRTWTCENCGYSDIE